MKLSWTGNLIDYQLKENRKNQPEGVEQERCHCDVAKQPAFWKYVGLDGDVVGIDRFGASAPGPKVMAEYGFTPENVAARAKALLKN